VEGAPTPVPLPPQSRRIFTLPDVDVTPIAGAASTPVSLQSEGGQVQVQIPVELLRQLIQPTPGQTPVAVEAIIDIVAPPPPQRELVVERTLVREVKNVDPATGQTVTETKQVVVNTQPPPDFSTGQVVKGASVTVDIRLERLITPVPGTTQVQRESVTRFAQPVDLAIEYAADVLPKETTEDDLALFFLDETTGKWVEVPGSQVDKTTRKVNAKVDHLTIFTVMAKVPFQKDINENVRYYGATQRYVAHGFKEYFDKNGGMDRFGLPITDEFERKGVTAQYFQRSRLEFHPELGNTITVANVGKELLEKSGGLPAPLPPPRGELPPTIRYFPETGHYVNLSFKQHLEENGGVESIGFPISEEIVFKGITAQWFEKGRLEWHPEIGKGVVLLGLVGDELAKLEGLRVFKIGVLTTAGGS